MLGSPEGELALAEAVGYLAHGAEIELDLHRLRRGDRGCARARSLPVPLHQERADASRRSVRQAINQTTTHRARSLRAGRSASPTSSGRLRLRADRVRVRTDDRRRLKRWESLSARRGGGGLTRKVATAGRENPANGYWAGDGGENVDPVQYSNSMIVKVAIVAMAVSPTTASRGFSIQLPSFRRTDELGVTPLGIISRRWERSRGSGSAIRAWIRRSSWRSLPGLSRDGPWAGGIAAIVPTLAGKPGSRSRSTWPRESAPGSRGGSRLPAGGYLAVADAVDTGAHGAPMASVSSMRMLVAGTEIVAIETSRFFGSRWFFSLVPNDPVSSPPRHFASLTCVGVSLKIRRGLRRTSAGHKDSLLRPV